MSWTTDDALLMETINTPTGFTPLFRKTLSAVGTRIGRRQVIGWCLALVAALSAWMG